MQAPQMPPQQLAQLLMQASSKWRDPNFAAQQFGVDPSRIKPIPQPSATVIGLPTMDPTKMTDEQIQYFLKILDK